LARNRALLNAENADNAIIADNGRLTVEQGRNVGRAEIYLGLMRVASPPRIPMPAVSAVTVLYPQLPLPMSATFRTLFR
jgi:hypothetical protein